MAKALDGITLIEFASHPACAYAAMLLAEQGARTIRIERPGGDPGRGRTAQTGGWESLSVR
jgi:crotonobetainyl-CoA:carnitine CoA-transferase CaiB-like acyl-CoA transferase